MTKITAKMTIGKILKANPHALKVLEQHGLACVNCHLSTMETLEEGAKGHGLSEDEIQRLVVELS